MGSWNWCFTTLFYFQEYLKEECGTCEALNFWFACNGLRKCPDPLQLVPIIWKKFIRNYAVHVSEKTYKFVNDRINAKSIDRNIFDAAQKEVRTTGYLYLYLKILYELLPQCILWVCFSHIVLRCIVLCSILSKYVSLKGIMIIQITPCRYFQFLKCNVSQGKANAAT